MTNNATWDGFIDGHFDVVSGTNAFGQQGTNWNPGILPDGIAIFPSFDDQGNPIVNHFISWKNPGLHPIQTMQFVGGLQYTFTLASGDILSISGSGLMNASGQTFNVGLTSQIIFSNSATADTATINASHGGAVFFNDTSTAGASTLTVVGDSPSRTSQISFSGISTGDNSTINVGDNAFVHFTATSFSAGANITLTSKTAVVDYHDRAIGGVGVITIEEGTLSFLDSSSAATLTISDSDTCNFLGDSDAGSAFIHIHSGGKTFFLGASSGGTSTLAIDTGGTLDISQHLGNVGVGGISGTGQINLGANNLIVDLSTGTNSFFGTISGTGGITVTTSGTFTLGGMNTFTGFTTIGGGNLILGPNAALPGGVIFQNGGGSGHAQGSVTDEAGPFATLSATAGLTLTLNAANQVGGTISGYVQGDTIDLAFHSFTAGDHFVWAENTANTGGQLSLLNGAGTVIANLNLTGAYTQGEFSVASDGHGGSVFSTTATATLTPTAINNVYEAVLQRSASQAEINGALATDAASGDAAAISQIVMLSEAQFNVDPVIQIIKLAIGAYPTAAQLAGWVPFVESAGVLQGQSQTNPLLDQMATAFVASDNFGKFYNNGTDVDPNSPVTAQEMQVIIPAATGVAATAAQIAAWVSTGLTVDQVFVDFSLGDQYTAASHAAIQQFLTNIGYHAAASLTSIVGAADAIHAI